MQVNFDAEIRLDISPFIASIQKAQNEVKQLSQQIDAINKKTVTIKAQAASASRVGSSSVAPDVGAGAGSAARIAAAKQEIELQDKLTDAEKINIKTQYEADKLWQKASDARNKDHQLWGRRIDDQIAGEERLRKVESDRIKASMQERAAATSKNHSNLSTEIDSSIAMREREGQVHSSQLKAQMQEQQKSANLKARQAQQAERDLSRERYALYDVAAAYTAVAAGAASVTVALAKTAIEFERAFVNVERTTDFTSAKIGAAADSARNDLKALASEIPVAFGQITQIATIGNQLGIAQGALTAFTETVAKFSSTTGVSVESTAMAFGRIGELLGVPAQEFEKMGSAIAFAGVNAVATEEQILSVTKEIATTAKMAKFSTADIIGLSTALSSLGIAPEAARGSIIRSFAGINAAISEGGDRLEQYAAIAGMSAQDFASTWQTNGQAAFNSFLQGLQTLSDQGQNLDSVLRGIGMKNVRDIQTIQKLGDNYAVYASSLADANQGFKEGSFLGDAYSKIQDTVAAKIEIMQNNFANLLDTLGQLATSDWFKGILDGINEMLVKLNQFAKSPLGQTVGGLVMILSTLVAAIAAVNAMSALGKASLRAFATAQTSLLTTTAQASVGMKIFDSILLKTGLSARISATSVTSMRVAVAALNTAFKAVKWFAIIGAVVAALDKLGQEFTSVEQKAENLLGGFGGLQDALTADITAYNDALKEFGGDVKQAEAATGVIAGLNTEIENNNSEVNKNIEANNLLNQFLGMTSQNTATLSTDVETLSFVIGENTIAWMKNAIAQSDAFKELAKNREGLEALIAAGFNVESALTAVASGNADQYFNTLTESVYQSASGFDQWLIENQQIDDSIRQSTSSMGVFGEVLYNGWKIIKLLTDAIPNLASWLASLFGLDITPLYNGLMATKNAVEGVVGEAIILGPVMGNANDQFARSNAESYAGQLDKVKNSAGGASRALRTVVDYANDLSGIFSRSFEIRFGRQDAIDNIAEGWASMAQSADDSTSAINDATDAIARANAEIAELTADKSVLSYQLTIAEKYGDEARAAQIRAKMAKIDQQVTEENQNIADAREQASEAGQSGNRTEEETRKLLGDQVKRYQGLIEMYAKTGMKKKGLQRETKKMKEEFLAQATALGISDTAIQPYLKSFDDMAKVIKNTPRNVDVKFKSELGPAQNAINEYLAKIRAASGTHTTTMKLVLPNTVGMKKIVDSEVYRFMLRAFENGTLTAKQFYKGVYGIDLRSFANGGFVSGPGTSTSDSIPAMLSNGEYVVKASAVGAYGVDFLNALNQQKVGSFGSSSSASMSTGGSTIAYLSPEDRALLKAVIDRPVNLYTENAKIASSANAGNVVLAQRGTK